VKAKQSKDVVEFSVALDGVAIFVHEQVPVKEFTLEQLKGIYTGKIKGWKDLGITLP
jgi:phosphate transport system substrate-binding protein